MPMSIVRFWVLPLLAVLVVVDTASAAAGPAPPKKTTRTGRLHIPEAVEMLLAILSGSGAGPGAGWFHPSQSRYDWKWLAERMDANRDGVITRQEFRGPSELFQRLDRDGDGKLTPADLDWSPRSPLARQTQMATMLFRRADADTNGRISRAEWDSLFKQAAGGKDHLTPEDLSALLFPRRPSGPPPAARKASAGAGMPSRWMLMKALFNGEIGSMREGPALGDMAPAFRLPTQDGKRTISLTDYRGKKPVVLIFGSFT
jgi:hypothetical protein